MRTRLRTIRFRPLILVLALLLTVPVSADNDDSMHISEAGIEIIKYYEGFSPLPYPDANGYAIGYGTHNFPKEYNNGITEEQAYALMMEDVEEMSGWLNGMCKDIGITLTQNEFDALISMTYNLGVEWMNSGYSLYNMLRAGIHYYSDEDIISTFGGYNTSLGEVLEILVQRRLTEAKIFLYSDYHTGGSPKYDYILDPIPDEDGDLHYLERVEAEYTDGKYTDLMYWDWYYPYVSPLTITGVIDGYEDGSFRGDGTVTYGESLKMILEAVGYEGATPTGTHWASGYYMVALNEGFVTIADGTDLDAAVDREFCAELLAKCLGVAPNYLSDSPFSDTDNPYIIALYELGMVEGELSDNGDRIYRPSSSLTRGELCTLIYRLTY